MPKESLAAMTQELSSLLAGMSENEALDVPHLQVLRRQLADILEAIQSLAAEQASLEGRRQAVTQQLRITRRHAQDIVVAVRGAIRAQLGHRNEGLVRYNIRPTRRRSRAMSEETGIALYPRPDLLAAAGLEPRPPGAFLVPEAAAPEAERAEARTEGAGLQENGAPPEEA